MSERTVVLACAVSLSIYVLSKAFDCQMKQASVVFSFCQGSVWIRRNKIRIINQGLNDLLDQQTHFQDLHHLESFYCPFWFSTRHLVIVFGSSPGSASIQFRVFYIMNPKQTVCSMQTTDIFVTGLGRYQACFHEFYRLLMSKTTTE